MKQNNSPQPLNRKGTRSLKDRVQKHLKDKNDIITEEDLKNIKVGSDVYEEDPEAAKELAESLEKKKVATPWDILDDDDNKR
jgi:hypothetical protein